MRPLLPEAVVNRTDKGHVDELMDTGLFEREQDRVRRAIGDGPLTRIPFIDADVLQEELRIYEEQRHLWWHPLWYAITAGLWLVQEEMLVKKASALRGECIGRPQSKGAPAAVFQPQ
jgi:hypothetical protein